MSLSTMAGTKAAKLLVILSVDDRRKMLLPGGIPKSVEELVDNVKEACGINENFRLQYQDKDFGDIFVNLTSTCDLENFGTLKVIPLPAEDTTKKSQLMETFSDIMSTGSAETDDTLSLSSSSSDTKSTRTQQWPKEFPIPCFSFDSELQLERGNAAYKANGTRLNLMPKTKSDILEKTIDEIYKYKAYPTSADFCEVSQALIKKHPCLAEPGSFNGCYGWTQRLKTKMGNFRTQLKGLGCHEFAVNSLKAKAPDVCPAKNVKRPKRGEANHIPCIPVGETAENLEIERQALLKEVKKRNNESVVKDKMAKTFALRRQEIVSKEPSVEELQERWPALFRAEEINAEFHRITTVPLQTRFFTCLDKWGTQLIELVKTKGGAVRQKTMDILKVLDQSTDISVRRECILKCLMIYLGEDVSHLIKEYLVVQKDEAECELVQSSMVIFVFREESDAVSTPLDIGIVIDGVEVLNELPSVACGCALLFGLIYTLNLKYPQNIKYTLETFQKVLMDIESRQMTRRVQNLSAKLIG